MTALIYDRKHDSLATGRAIPAGGEWGQITLRSVCETIERFGGIRAGSRVTHLVIEGDTISYRVEPRGGRT